MSFMLKESNDNKKEEEEEEKEKEKEKEKDELDERFRTLFKKIRTFEQLKREVYEIKTSYENTCQELNDYKEKYDEIMKKYNILNKNKGTSFEQLEDEKNYKNYLSDKLFEIDRKFELILGDIDINEDDIVTSINAKDLKETNHKNITNINNNITNNSKSEQGKKNNNIKLLNLIDINKRLAQLNLSKLNTTDFDFKTEVFAKKISDVDVKINELISKLFREKVENADEFENIKNISFVSKDEFEKHKNKSNEEFERIWEEINNLKKLYDQIYNNLNNKPTLSDLESMRDLILKKIEELFKVQNKKLSGNSYLVQNLQDHFKKLLELLAVREEKEKDNNWLITKKPAGGFSCASCETFIGDLKADKSKYIYWNKLPRREKEGIGEKFGRIGNGYSHLLQMVNFDSNGNISLNLLANYNENNKNNNSSIFSNNSEKSRNLNKSSSKERCKSTKSKKDQSQTIDVIKSKNDESKEERKLPRIKCSMSTDNFEKLAENDNSSNQNNSSFGGGGIIQVLILKALKFLNLSKKHNLKNKYMFFILNKLKVYFLLINLIVVIKI